MKFLRLIGYGNNFTHVISLKSISDISFEPGYTHITLNNGSSINIVENETEIVSMIYHLEGFITSKEAASLHEFYQHCGSDAWNTSPFNDELPF
jgi:hypothetical protein